MRVEIGSTNNKYMDYFFMTKLATVATIAAILTSPTLAQADENWTGLYAGAQVGISNLSALGVGDTDTTYGLHVGYNHDMGSFVLGGELDYSTAEYSVGGVSGDIDTTRLKLKGGYDAGRALVYGVVGFASLDDRTSSESGYTIGLGVSFKATENIIVGAEILRDSVEILGQDLDADSFTLRASYKF